MNITLKLGSALAAAAVIAASMVTPVFANTSINVNGNGSRSNNSVDISMDHSMSISQNNDTRISNDVWTSSNTGDNNASENTGGDVSIRTGDANSRVDITNQAGLNVADISS